LGNGVSGKAADKLFQDMHQVVKGAWQCDDPATAAIIQVNTDNRPSEYIRATVWFKLPDYYFIAMRIAIHIFEAEHPRCTLFRRPLTTQMLHFDGIMVTVPHVKYTRIGAALINRECLPLVAAFDSVKAYETHADVRANDARIVPIDVRYSRKVNPYTVHSTFAGDTCTFAFRDLLWGREQYQKTLTDAIVWHLLPPTSVQVNLVMTFFVQRTTVT
jgi:hypothetical protein